MDTEENMPLSDMSDTSIEDVFDEDEDINVNSAFLGQAGEYLTAGKLLLNGFNVFKGAVDDGIDIVASKNNTFYKFQVKTCQDVEGYDSGRYMASINLSTLSTHDKEATYAVLVVHYLNAQISVDFAAKHSFYDQDFIVIPVTVLFDFLDKSEGRYILHLYTTITTQSNGEGYMYKLRHQRRDLILDDLIESFGQIGSVLPKETP